MGRSFDTLSHTTIFYFPSALLTFFVSQSASPIRYILPSSLLQLLLPVSLKHCLSIRYLLSSKFSLRFCLFVCFVLFICVLRDALSALLSLLLLFFSQTDWFVLYPAFPTALFSLVCLCMRSQWHTRDRRRQTASPESYVKLTIKKATYFTRIIYKTSISKHRVVL